jgi:CBS domain-containing protein
MKYAVRELMTSAPHTVAADQTIEDAARLLEAHGIHHLPVIDGHALVGVVDARGLRLAAACRSSRSEPMLVREAVNGEPYVVGPDSPVAPVLRHMADAQIDAAVVMSSGRVVGIFCVFDALHALAKLTASRPGFSEATSPERLRREV